MLTLRGASSCKRAWGMKHWTKVKSTQCSSRPPSSCFPTPGFSTSSQFPLPCKNYMCDESLNHSFPTRKTPSVRFCPSPAHVLRMNQTEREETRNGPLQPSASQAPFRTHDTSMWTSSDLACLMTCSSLSK